MKCEVIPKLSSPPSSQKRALNVVERASLSSLPIHAFMPSNSTTLGAAKPPTREIHQENFYKALYS